MVDKDYFIYNICVLIFTACFVLKIAPFPLDDYKKDITACTKKEFHKHHGEHTTNTITANEKTCKKHIKVKRFSVKCKKNAAKKVD